MTREEAYAKIFASQAGKKISAYDIAPSVFCDYLEALGLIEFNATPMPKTILQVTGKVAE